MYFFEYKHLAEDIFDRINDVEIDDVVETILYAINKNIEILLVSNGGSLVSSSHFAQDLIKICGARAKCLGDNQGLFSALSNDEGYENVFSWQLENYREKDALIIAVSCSGNSKNVLKAVDVANRLGFCTISFTGSKFGKLCEMTDIDINSGSENVCMVEGIHSVLFHFIVEEIQRRLSYDYSSDSI